MSRQDIKNDEKEYAVSESSQGLQIAATVIFVLVFAGLFLISSQTSRNLGSMMDNEHQAFNVQIQALQQDLESGKPAGSLLGPFTKEVHDFASSISDLSSSSSARSGVIGQILMLFSVAITLLTHKKGYIAATICNAIHLVSVIQIIMTKHLVSAIPGLIVPVSTIILLTIIYLSSNKIIAKNKEISENYTKLLETNRMIKEQDEKLSYLAYYDLLTDLPNRMLFIDKLDETIINSPSSPFTVLLGNLDNFKQINNDYGNNAGDRLLNTYADKLKDFCKENSIFLARLGGDEFGFIIQGSMTEANILNYVEKIMNIIGETVQIGDTGDYVQSTLSFGIASYPANAATSGDILRCLDNAKFFAKSNGKNRPCFYGQQ